MKGHLLDWGFKGEATDKIIGQWVAAANYFFSPDCDLTLNIIICYGALLSTARTRGSHIRAQKSLMADKKK